MHAMQAKVLRSCLDRSSATMLSFKDASFYRGKLRSLSQTIAMAKLKLVQGQAGKGAEASLSKFINSSYQLFFALFFSFNNKKHKNLLKPLFYSVLANLKKENFQKFNLKQRNLKNPIFAPIFRKRLFLENWQITGHKKTHKMITEGEIARNPYFYSAKTNLVQIITLAWPR